MKTRNGKIARLPKDMREEINRRLQNGEPAETILRRLNKQEDCRDTVEIFFDGRPVSPQNLSEWRQGGYEDWLRKEERLARIRDLTEDAKDFEREGDDHSIADRVATMMEMELMEVAEQLQTITDPDQRWTRMREILSELHRLRREDHNAQRTLVAREKWRIQNEREKAEACRAEKERKAKYWHDVFYSYHDQLLRSQLLGGGEYGWKWSDWLRRVKFDMPMPDWWNPKKGNFEFQPECYEPKPDVQNPQSRVEPPASHSRHRSEAKTTQAGAPGNGTEKVVGKNGTDGTEKNGKSESIKPNQSDTGLKSESNVQCPASKAEGPGHENEPPDSLKEAPEEN